MNKLFVALLGTGIAALILAIGCGSWLFLQSWEEGKRLERQNRELAASLEASRIRLENFCEYPAEALCNLEDQKGSVSSAMSGFAGTTPRTSLPEVPSSAIPDSSASSPDGRTDASEAETSSSMTPNETGPGSVAASSEAQASAEKTAAPQMQPTPSSSPELSVRTKTDVPAATTSENDSRPTGKNKEVSSDGQAKKTWTSLEVNRTSMTLRIAGEGSSLTAEGRLMQDPLRYEVTLHGRWNIRSRNPENQLIRKFRQEFREGNTILTFLLEKQPELREVQQEDKRTVAIRLR